MVTENGQVRGLDLDGVSISFDVEASSSDRCPNYPDFKSMARRDRLFSRS